MNNEQSRPNQRSILRYGLFDNKGPVHALDVPEKIAAELGVDITAFPSIHAELCALRNHYQHMKKRNPARHPLEDLHNELEVPAKLGLNFFNSLRKLKLYNQQRVNSELLKSLGLPAYSSPLKFQRVLEQLQNLAEVLDRAYKSAPRAKPGRDDMPELVWLTIELGDIWEKCTGHPLSSSIKKGKDPKEFLWLVLRQADPEVTRTNVSTLLRRAVHKLRACQERSDEDSRLQQGA
jgi:hypothetical protein